MTSLKFFCTLCFVFAFCARQGAFAGAGNPRAAIDSIGVISLDEHYRYPFMHASIGDFIYFFDAAPQEVRKYEPCMFTITDGKILKQFMETLSVMTAKATVDDGELPKLQVRIGLKLYQGASTRLIFIRPGSLKAAYAADGTEYKDPSKLIRATLKEISKRYKCKECQEEKD